MIIVRHNNERGAAHHGWLESMHTFSFASYYDPRYMGVSALRVINDDKVAAGRGFATHSHQDMEIISYVKKGVIEHKDSMGNIERLPTGEFQLMSAGTGVTHSEYNPSTSESLEFLQIWIEPNEYGVHPGYQQKKFARKPGLNLIISPDGKNGSLKVHQNACLYQLILSKDETAEHTLQPARTVYVHVVSGNLEINRQMLGEGDGASIKDITDIHFSTDSDTEALVFDLP